MIAKQFQKKGILAKLLERGIRILLIKECKKISNLKIDILSSSAQIITGRIQKTNIFAENINYKDLLFDELELEANHLRLNLHLNDKELNLKDSPTVKFKISLSQNSLKTVLLSNSWNWIGNMVSKEILNQENLEDITIRNDELLMKAFGNDINLRQGEFINIKTDRGKVYLGIKNHSKFIQIPIEDKIYIEKIFIKNNLLNIIGISPISF